MGYFSIYKNNGFRYMNDNIQVNFASSDIVVSVMRSLYVIVILVGYPIFVFQVRASIASWFGIEHDQTKC